MAPHLSGASAVVGLQSPGLEDTGWRGSSNEVSDMPPHLAGRGIERRGNRWGQRFTREEALIQSSTGFRAQILASHLAGRGY